MERYDAISFAAMVIGVIVIAFLGMSIGTHLSTALPLNSPSSAPTINNKTDKNVLKIAIIDTGYSAALAKANNYEPLKLCDEGHYDYTAASDTVGFNQKHGTIVGSIIAEKLKNVKYCALIYQVMVSPVLVHRGAIGDALNKAYQAGAKYVNISLTGEVPDSFERAAIESFIANKNRFVFVAAGNESRNLDKRCNSFPACYSFPGFLYTVGATDYKNNHLSSSNYGNRVNLWYPGIMNWDNGLEFGTSFASPRALSDFAYDYAVKNNLTNTMESK